MQSELIPDPWLAHL